MEKNKKKSHDHAYNNGSVKKKRLEYDDWSKNEVNKNKENDEGKSKGATRTARGLITLAVIAVLILLGVESYRFAYRIANGSAVDSPPGRPVQVYIRDSMSPGDVAEMLKEKGLLDGTIEFVVHAKLKGYNPSKYTGSHTLNTSMNAEQQLSELMNINGE